MALETMDYANGISIIIFSLISIFLGLIIASKYRTYKIREYILVGFAWIGIASPWFPGSLAFLHAIFTGEGISFELYFILGNVLIPICLVLWLIAVTDFLFKDYQKIILVIIIVYVAIFYIFFFILLSQHSPLIGYLKGPIDVQNGIFLIIFDITFVIIFLISGLLFSKESLKTDNPEIKLKGRLLLMAFLCYTIGAILDSLIPLTWITLPIIRSVEILSAIAFYYGFTLPKWIKKILLKN